MSPAGCDHQASLTCLTLAPPDSIFNLREENKQLRKAHHDIHTQLQDAQVSSRSALPAAAPAGSPSTPSALCVQVRHQDLKAAHDQLALNLQDHKSALAAAQVGPAGSWSGHSGSLTASSHKRSALVRRPQVQVDAYKQLKESLNAAPEVARLQPNAAQNPPESHHPQVQEPGHHPDHGESKVTRPPCSSSPALPQQHVNSSLCPPAGGAGPVPAPAGRGRGGEAEGAGGGGDGPSRTAAEAGGGSGAGRRG